MTYDADGLKSLFRLTLRAPRAAAAALVSDPPPRQAVWLMIWLLGVVFALVFVGSSIASGVPLPIPGPFGVLFLPPAVVVSVLISTLVLSEAGRVFGGRGRFWDVLLTSVWLSVVNMVLTVAQIILAQLVPPLVDIVQIGLFLWLLWIGVAMLQEVHGFATPWPAIGAYVLAVVMTVGLVLVLSMAVVWLGGVS